MYSVYIYVFCVSLFFSLLFCIVFIVCLYMMPSYMEEIKNLSTKCEATNVWFPHTDIADTDQTGWMPPCLF